jgi:hypothetical protein
LTFTKVINYALGIYWFSRLKGLEVERVEKLSGLRS